MLHIRTSTTKLYMNLLSSAVSEVTFYLRRVNKQLITSWFYLLTHVCALQPEFVCCQTPNKYCIFSEGNSPCQWPYIKWEETWNYNQEDTPSPLTPHQTDCGTVALKIRSSHMAALSLRENIKRQCAIITVSFDFAFLGMVCWILLVGCLVFAVSPANWC